MAFRHCLSRRPLPQELEELRAVLDVSEAYYDGHPEDAGELSPRAPELAPLVATVRVVLNLDEFLTRN